MPFIIETWDKPGSLPVRRQERAAHLAFLARNAPKLLACGAKLHDDGTDIGGGVYVIEAKDRAEAEAFIASDPYSLAGLFERVQITRWRKAYVAGECFIPQPA